MEEFGSRDELAALTADLVGSRGLADRDAVQRRLRATLAAVPAVVGPERLVAGPSLDRGDEVQLVARDAFTAFRALLYLADAIRPVELTFGIGLGPLTTALEQPVQPVGQLDGPCLHHAREALDRARADGRWGAVAGLRDADLGLAADGLIALLGALRRGWTEKQAVAVAEARTGRYQKDIAADLGVAPSVISERLKAAHWDAVQWGERGLEALFAAAGQPSPQH